MSEGKYSILRDWPGLKEDMIKFLVNPYKWIEVQLEEVRLRPDMETVRWGRRDFENLLDIVKTVNDIYSPSLVKRPEK